MTDPVAKAFLSYSHSDNDREGGRILRLADHIKNEFGLLTGSEIEIFTDNDVEWGDDWRERISQALQETTFFIPVLTPTYFGRPECRNEMTKFTSSADTLGLRKLLLSIRYIAVPDLTEESADELKARAASIQFEPWHNLRLLAEDSPDHRAAINRLASRLAELTQELEGGGEGSAAVPASAKLVSSGEVVSAANGSPDLAQTAKRSSSEEDGQVLDVPAAAVPGEVEYDDEDDGPLDVLLDAQPALEDWQTTLSELAPATNRFNAKFNSATERLNGADGQPNAFAVKVRVLRELAVEVEPDLAEIENLSKSYSEALARVDRVIRAIYDMARISGSPEAESQLIDFRANIRGLVASSAQARDGLQGAADAARANARLSKDLRPVLRRFETAVRNIIDGSTLIESWGDL